MFIILVNIVFYRNNYFSVVWDCFGIIGSLAFLVFRYEILLVYFCYCNNVEYVFTRF